MKRRREDEEDSKFSNIQRSKRRKVSMDELRGEREIPCFSSSVRDVGKIKISNFSQSRSVGELENVIPDRFEFAEKCLAMYDHEMADFLVKRSEGKVMVCRYSGKDVGVRRVVVQMKERSGAFCFVRDSKKYYYVFPRTLYEKLGDVEHRNDLLCVDMSTLYVLWKKEKMRRISEAKREVREEKERIEKEKKERREKKKKKGEEERKKMGLEKVSFSYKKGVLEIFETLHYKDEFNMIKRELNLDSMEILREPNDSKNYGIATFEKDDKTIERRLFRKDVISTKDPFVSSVPQTAGSRYFYLPKDYFSEDHDDDQKMVYQIYDPFSDEIEIMTIPDALEYIKTIENKNQRFCRAMKLLVDGLNPLKFLLENKLDSNQYGIKDFVVLFDGADKSMKMMQVKLCTTFCKPNQKVEKMHISVIKIFIDFFKKEKEEKILGILEKYQNSIEAMYEKLLLVVTELIKEI